MLQVHLLGVELGCHTNERNVVLHVAGEARVVLQATEGGDAGED